MRRKTLSSREREVVPTKRVASEVPRRWTFLSNHSHVIICLARNPEMRVRDIATAVGITERATIRILTELEKAGYIQRERVGRRNHYSIVADQPLRHPLEAHHSIRLILALAKS